MAPYGSGRRKVEQMLRLDIAQLNLKGLPRSAVMRVTWPSGNCIAIMHTASGCLKLTYRTRSGDEDWRTVEELVPLTTTPVHLGGERVWFRCPGCDRRVRVLYGGHRFACRHCHRLFYTSQSEGPADRANRGMFRIVKKLDPAEHFSGLPPRPKGMSWRTYQRLAERYYRYEEQWSAEVMRRFGSRLR
jgi:hypothetical protein